MKSSAVKKCVIFLAVIIFFLPLFGVKNYEQTSAATSLSDLKQKEQDLIKKQKSLEADLKKLAGQKSEEENYQDLLKTKMEIAESQIEVINQKLVLMNEEIEKTQAAATAKQQEIDENYELFKERLRANYIAGDPSTLSIILGASNFSDFLTRSEMVQRIANHDKKLLAQLTADKLIVEAYLEKIQQDKETVEAEKANLSAVRIQLSEDYAKSTEAMAQYNQLAEKYSKNRAELDAQMNEVDKQIEESIRNSQGAVEYDPSAFLWPVPGFQTISCHFGWRILYGVPNNHTGTDIAGYNIFGANAVASKSGIVITAMRTYTAGVGYGMYVTIDHGGGYATVYAHLSQVSVNVGDYLRQGEVVGKIGSTGNSTGPHLHFEIRVNGVAQNPMNWF